MGNLELLLIILSVTLIFAGGYFFIKRELDKKKVRVIIASSDRRLTTYKVKPVDKTVSVEGKTYNINDTDFMMIKNMPTYIFNDENTQPIDLFTGIQSPYSPHQYQTAIENKLVEEIFKSSKKGKSNDSPIIMILLIAVIGAVGLIGYLGYDFIETILIKLDSIIEALKNAGIEV